MLHFALSGNDRTPIVRYLDINHGLSNNVITSIFQDHHGFLWFGTYDGLNKYDGYSFTVYRNVIEDTNSIGDSQISAISEDSEYNMWIGTRNGLTVYNPLKGRFYQCRYKTPSGEVTEIGGGARGIVSIGKKVFVGTGRGLLVFTLGSGIGEVLRLTKGPAVYSVSSVAYDSARNELWALASGNLYKYDENKNELMFVAEAVKKANCIGLSGTDLIWVGTENGLFSFSKSTRTFSENRAGQPLWVTAIVLDAENNLWVSTEGMGVWMMPHNSQQINPFRAVGGGINSNAIATIYVDKDDRKWIGTLRGGINILENSANPFRKISFPAEGPTDLAANFILSFCEDTDAKVWIGTDGGGIWHWDRHGDTYTRYVKETSTLSSNFITNIAKDHQDNLWIATWFGGINRLDKGTRSFRQYRCYNPVAGRYENNIWFIREDGQQRLWASATNNGCLYLYNRTADQFELFDAALVNLQAMTEDGEGNLWAGNYSSIIRIDPVGKKHKLIPVGYPVRSIRDAGAGRLWVGTGGGGLLLFDVAAGTFKRFTTNDGLLNNTVLRILEDKNGELWISTFAGLSRFNPFTGTFKNFTQSDGLQSNQFSFNAGLALQSGEFMFGGLKGFNIFHPDDIENAQREPAVLLTGLWINNRPAYSNDTYIREVADGKIRSITVPASEANLSIDFTAIAFNDADKLRYAVYLEGWDRSWGNGTNSRAAVYSRLNAGNYTLHVRTTKSDGTWGADTVLLTIRVLPPWYATWWAYLLYGATVLAACVVYLRYSKRQQQMKFRLQLANLEKLQEKQMTENKLSFFTHVSHEFRTPLTLIINPLKDLLADEGVRPAHPTLTLIQRNAKRLLSLVDQLLLFRKVESVDQQLNWEKLNLGEICNDVYLSFLQLATSKNLALTYAAPEQEVQIYGDREKIEIVLFNLVSNALKYTQEGEVNISIHQLDEHYEVWVKDTGPGIAPELAAHLFESFHRGGNKTQAGFGIGLHVSQKLAKAHSGHISFTTDPGGGSLFKLTLTKNAHLFGTEIALAVPPPESRLLNELVAGVGTSIGEPDVELSYQTRDIEKVVSGLPTMVVIDDDPELRAYLQQIFERNYTVYTASDGEAGYEMVRSILPDIVISDVAMDKMDGIAVCKKIKSEKQLAHIPVILLTGSVSEQSKVSGFDVGADDYIGKPFDRNMIVARVENILRAKSRMQQYFLDSVLARPTMGFDFEHKEFVDRCIAVVELHIDNPEFGIQAFCRELGVSHPTLYRRIKTLSGLTIVEFIRSLRLRKSADLLITTGSTVNQVAMQTGFNDIKYFREQFVRLFGMTPSNFIKKYRQPLGNRKLRDLS
ncbi:two-component regulator propeller domain-containing protein [uncultured Chitinophaga sp.]|uniref:two-component regulator propeller domain-containing protein n=1 Tax=uncultured Chitinophaga sp. TaxID=339340 RepID=UPI0025D346FF|nr:two-component regulator propeller domain-containing protein [uncultured Chitinophaga sp.]